MYCSNCGKKLVDGAKICGSCQQSVEVKGNQISANNVNSRTQNNNVVKNKLSKKVIIIVITVIIVITIGFKYFSNKSDVNHRGNTVGNIVNRGIAAEQGDWIYYTNLDDGRKIYKIKTDGTERTKITDDISRYINVVGD